MNHSEEKCNHQQLSISHPKCLQTQIPRNVKTNHNKTSPTARQAFSVRVQKSPVILHCQCDVTSFFTDKLPVCLSV